MMALVLIIETCIHLDLNTGLVKSLGVDGTRPAGQWQPATPADGSRRLFYPDDYVIGKYDKDGNENWDTGEYKHAPGWRKIGIIVHIIGVMYMLVGLNTVCDIYFCGALDEMVEKWQITPDVAGATFMAAGGSAPELFTSIIGVFLESDVGFGTIVGSAVFNVLAVIGACGLAAQTPFVLSWWPLFRDCSFYIVSLLFLAVFSYGKVSELPNGDKVGGGEIKLYEAIILFCLYLLYCMIMVFNEKAEAKVKGFVARFGKNKDTQVMPLADGEVGPADDGDGLKKAAVGEASPAPPSSGPAILADSAVQGGETQVVAIDAEPQKPETLANPEQPKGDATALAAPAALLASSSQVSGLVMEAHVSKHVEHRHHITDRHHHKHDKNEHHHHHNKETRISEHHLRRVQHKAHIPHHQEHHEHHHHHDKASAPVAAAKLVDDVKVTDAEITDVTAKEADSEVKAPDAVGDVKAPDAEGRVAAPDAAAETSSTSSSEASEDDIANLVVPPGGMRDNIMWVACLPIYAALYYCIPRPSPKMFLGTFSVSLLFIAGFSYFLVYCVEMFGTAILGGGNSVTVVMAFTILAAGTSVPDLVSSMAVARAGEGDMAVSSSIGSNIFDILVGLPLPWILKIGIIEMGINGESDYGVKIKSPYIALYVFLLLFMVAAVIISIMANKWLLNNQLGAMMSVLYFVFLAIVLPVELINKGPYF